MVFAGLRSAALEDEGDGGGDEIDDHKADKVEQEFLKIGWACGFWMEVAADEIGNAAEGEHDVDKR